MASMSLYMRSLKHGFRPPRRPRPKLSYICMGRTGPDRNRADSTRFCEQASSAALQPSARYGGTYSCLTDA